MFVKKGMLTERELELAGVSVKSAVDTYFSTEGMKTITHIDIVSTSRIPDDYQVRLQVLGDCPKGHAEGALSAAITGAQMHFGDSVPVQKLPEVRKARERTTD